MRTMLLIAAIAGVSARGEETPSNAMRQKLRARIMESFPLPQPAKPADEKKARDESVIVMKPVVVESSRARNLEAFTRDNQKKEEEKFSLVGGGTLYVKDIGRVRAELGGWWTPRQGWSFLRFSW